MRCFASSLTLYFIVVSFIATANATNTHKFKVTTSQAAPVMIIGTIEKPKGDGPFPAVILLHGCAGLLPSWGGAWAKRLTKWGYVAFRIDSFGSRGVDNVCVGLSDLKGAILRSPTLDERAVDALKAKSYLETLSFVDKEKIALLGMSNGGATTLAAIQNEYIGYVPNVSPFSAAVALYPYCPYKIRPGNPLLILIGDADEWTPSENCEKMRIRGPKSSLFELIVYDGALHSFDIQDVRREHSLGYVLDYHPQAAPDAYRRVREFFHQHLGR